jgi:phage terminase large subunit-like protein
VLLSWQAFIVGSIFGWKTAAGFRRFRMAFIEAGKGNGKSPLSAGIGLYMLAFDREPRAEIYAAAQKKDQAKVLFRDAVAMVQQSPDLDGLLYLSGDVEKFNIAHLTSGSFFRPISTEERGRGQSGPRPHCALLDEIHEHSTNAMVEFTRAGIKGRRQSLIFMITNAGVDRTSVCYDYHDYASKVAAGAIGDDSFFGYVCALDEQEDPFDDPACWVKANPSLGVTIPSTYLEEQVTQARGIPSKQNLVRRLNFCQWTDAQAAWIGKDTWEACEREIDQPSHRGQPCGAGLDLGAKRDLTALALVFEQPDGTLDAWLEFWTPADTLRARQDVDRVPYDVWVREGHLVAIPGATVDYRYVAQRMGELMAAYDIQGVAFDRWRIDDFQRALDEEGIENFKASDAPAGSGLKLIECGQGFKDMSPAVELLEEAILRRRLRIHRNPVLRWNISSVMLEQDPAGNRKFTKRKATGRIDGVVALAMAIAKLHSGNPTMIDYQPGQMYGG